jgi:GNAT superfamily N-acetyltransferase
MNDNGGLAARLAAAHAAAFDTIVAGVRCQSVPIAEPWATQARPIAPGTDLDPVRDWLRDHSPQWTVAVPAWLAGEPEYAGLTPWLTLPMYVLTEAPEAKPVSGLEMGPAGDAAEFLSVYGAHLAPLVELADPTCLHLVGRLDGRVVACAKVRVLADTAYVSAVTVLSAYQKRGIGSALSAEASRLGGERAGIVWLHAAEHARRIYERLGYRLVGEHVLLAEPQAKSAK